MATGVRDKITLACTDCKRRNYETTKSKRNTPDRVELRKYCRWCGGHTGPRDTRQPYAFVTDTPPTRGRVALARQTRVQRRARRAEQERQTNGAETMPAP